MPLKSVPLQHLPIGSSKKAKKVRFLTQDREHVVHPLVHLPMDIPPRIVSVTSSKEATVRSWFMPYQGNIDQVFYEYTKSRNNPDLYARVLAIVQSDGMGKSRMIDELSKVYFVIPLNLCVGESGYPPPDSQVRSWFMVPGLSPTQSNDRCSAFLAALLEKTLEIVKDPQRQIHNAIMESFNLEDEEIAAALQHYPSTLQGQFRLFMTVGQTFSKQGDLRIKFYDRVIKRTNQLFNQAPERPAEFDVDLLVIVRQLLQIINPDLGDVIPSLPPTLFLAFDEADTISTTTTTNGVAWSQFSALRQALHAIRLFPVWSLFLSTTVELAPTPVLNRIGESQFVLKPFSALGFDLLAEVLSCDESYSLDHVSSLRYQVSLGRPLWLSRYENGDDNIKRTIVIFAIEKLLCRPYNPKENMATSLEEQFAVLSHRLALEFDTPSCSGWKRMDAERNQIVQVKKHMRVCLDVEEGSETIVTVAASEPILVRAAATVMQHKDFSSCRTLHDISKWPGIRKGDRGEHIVANITIDTLDGLAFKDRTLLSFVVKTTSYFEALFAQNLYKDNIQNAMPSRLRDDSDEAKTFGETFKDSYIYVTHFIKFCGSVLTDGCIMALAARGIAIIYADNQTGVDMILPMVYKDKVLRRTNMTVIMIQSKNDEKFSIRPHGYLFDSMNPFIQGIFNRQEKNPRPVIRMVYALAARKPIVRVMKCGQPTPQEASKGKGKARDRSTNCSFTSFDIWCGHASSSTFGAIHPEDDETYRKLLKRSKPDVVEIFEPEQQYMKEMTMHMYPGATGKDAHWSSFIDVTRVTGVANVAPSDDKDSSGESGSDGESEQYMGRHASSSSSSPKPKSAGLSSTGNRGATMRSASPEKHTPSSKLEAPGPSFADHRDDTRRSQRIITKKVTKPAQLASPTTEPLAKRHKGQGRK